MGCACVKAKIGKVRPLPVRMEVGGRNEAAKRRQSIALQQRTFSTVENHINHVKHHKDREESLKGDNDVVTEEHAGNNVVMEGQIGTDENIALQSCRQANAEFNLGTSLATEIGSDDQ